MDRLHDENRGQPVVSSNTTSTQTSPFQGTYIERFKCKACSKWSRELHLEPIKIPFNHLSVPISGQSDLAACIDNYFAKEVST